MNSDDGTIPCSGSLPDRIDLFRGAREPVVCAARSTKLRFRQSRGDERAAYGKKAAAALTLLGDAAKGWLAVFLAQRFSDSEMGAVAMAAAAVAVVLGHMFPVFFRFEGGKGVSTALGVLLAINVYLAAGAVATWLIFAAFFRYSSLAALASALFAPFFTLILYDVMHPFFWSMLAIAALLIWRHKNNIRNLLAGKETRFGSRAGH